MRRAGGIRRITGGLALAALGLAALAAAGCGDGGGGGDALPDAGPPAECAEPTEVTGAPELKALLGKLGFPQVGPYTSTVLEASGDVRVKGTVRLEASEVAPPASCSTYGCRPEPTFRVRTTTPGVTCEAPERVAWFQACGELSITDATVRFRGTVQDTHPGEYNFVAVVDVLPRCEAPCSGSQLRCNLTNTCFNEFDEYCRLCLALDKQACPCLSPEGEKADGTQCQFMTSGDTAMGGLCQNGVCQPL